MLFTDAYNALVNHLDTMDIVDSHEHLPAETSRVSRTVDFSELFSHYVRGDLLSAGMQPPDVDAFFAPDTPLARKWALFEPWYAFVQDGAYCRAAHLAMERFYEMPRLTSLGDAERLTDIMRKANQPGLYHKVLVEACGIRKSMNFGSLDDDPVFFAPVIFATRYAEEFSRSHIQAIEDHTGCSCSTLDRYVEAVAKEIAHIAEKGAKGLKFHFAYMRDLYFAPVSHADAESIYHRITDEGYGWRPSIALGYEECRPLQDYMVHRLIEMAEQHDLPVVIHSGFQAYVQHKPYDANPMALWNIALRYRRVHFIILHAGMPWVEEAAILAKQYPNIYLDMAWQHIMSPEIAQRALRVWLDMVPMNKIFGFGGDYCVVEKVYGHLVMARRNLATALATKIAMGDLSTDRALSWLKAILWDNPSFVYKV